jgi:hypothetical protein
LDQGTSLGRMCAGLGLGIGIGTTGADAHGMGSSGARPPGASNLNTLFTTHAAAAGCARSGDGGGTLNMQLLAYLMSELSLLQAGMLNAAGPSSLVFDTE